MSTTTQETSWTSKISSNGKDRRGTSLPQRDRTSKSRTLLAVLLVVGCALTGALLFMTAGGKSEVVTLAKDVAKGQVITRADLNSTSVAGVSGAVPVEYASSVIGKTAAVDLVDGQVLISKQVTEAAVPGAGEALVGLSLEPARIPAGLRAGDLVDVIAVPAVDAAAGSGAAKAGEKEDTALEAPRVLAAGATVNSVDGSATAGGSQLLTVVVKDADASRLAAYSTSNRVAVVTISSRGN